MVEKIRLYIVSRPLLVTIVTFAIGIAVDWLTKFLQSIQGAPSI
jgi:hypothetical protein